MEGEDTFGKLLESPFSVPPLGKCIALARFVADDLYPGVKGAQGSEELPHRFLFKIGSFDADAVDVVSQVEEVLLGLVGGCLQDVAQLVELLVQGRDGHVIRVELHGIHPLVPQGAEAIAVQHLAHFVEAYLLF